MIHNIYRDNERYKHIVKREVKKDIEKYISRTDIIYRKGDKIARIPIPVIDLPNFRYGGNQGGVGQGEGEIGDPISAGQPMHGQGHDAGTQPGQPHELYMEFSLEELAKILGEGLQLPNIQDKGKKGLYSDAKRKTTIIKTGPESLRSFKHTYKQALKRMIASGIYNIEKPIVIPEKEDKRYRYFKKKLIPRAQAVVIYMMDTSGSMDGDPYKIVMLESFWIETWLKSQYKVVEFAYIIHDAAAQRVNSQEYRNLFAGGGTLFHPAYRLCEEIIKKDFPPDEWNIYPFHFTDGENAYNANYEKGTEKDLCTQSIDKILEVANQFSYCQINLNSQNMPNITRFDSLLKEKYGKNEKVVVSKLTSKDDIAKSIKEFFGKGN